MLREFLWKVVLFLVVAGGIAIYYFFFIDHDTYNGLKITEQQSIDKNVEKVSELLPDGNVISKITFTPQYGEGITKYSGQMRFYLYQQNSDSMILYVVSLGSDASEPYTEDANRITKDERLMTKDTALPLSKIDFSKIAQYVNQAGEQIANEGKQTGEPMFFSGVGPYTMYLNTDPSKIHHEFSIESRDTTQVGVNTDYYFEYKFMVDADGKLKEVD